MVAYALSFILLAMKRGAILIGMLCFIYFLYNSLKLAKKKEKLIVTSLCVIIMMGGIYYLDYLWDTSDYFQYRIEQVVEGNSSGRDNIYSKAIHHWLNETSTLQFIFGGGAYTSIKVLGTFAHNDWLELALNQGILGILFYLIYWFSFYKEWKRKTYDSRIYFVVGSIFLIYFLSSFISMSYTGMTMYTTICLGYCLAQKNVIHEKNFVVY